MAQIKNRLIKDSRKRVLLVDDHAVVRYGISQLLNRESDLVVCGEEEDAGNALDAIRRLKPDLVIADLSLKDSSGLELARNIKAAQMVINTNNYCHCYSQCCCGMDSLLFVTHVVAVYG